MWTRRLAVDPGRGRRKPGSLLAVPVLVLALAVPAFAQAPSTGEPLIADVRSNGVDRGEVSLMRMPDGDFWVLGADLPKLKVAPAAKAARQAGKETYYSLLALGASELRLDEKLLLLTVLLPAGQLPLTEIDLTNRLPPAPVEPSGTSLILSYRLAASRSSEAAPTEVILATDANVRTGPLLLRQELRMANSPGQRRAARGATQAIWDDVPNLRRLTAGDVVSTAGSFGGLTTGAGVMLQKLYTMQPDFIKQPTASLRAIAKLPSDVQVDVDGTPVYRGTVAPGPIALDNLLLYGGTRNVRLTITDASGRREVIEQPYFFTNTVLAQGLHEYSYFAGKRSVLRPDFNWHYAEPAWQAFHRFGATDWLTVGAGGEGSTEFTSGGAGLDLRLDRVGLVSFQALASRDRQGGGSTAGGWAASYSYLVPNASIQVGRRHFGDGYRTFGTSAAAPYLRDETRLALATRVAGIAFTAEYLRSRDALQERRSAVLRASSQLTPSLLLAFELQAGRLNGARDDAAVAYLRWDLDASRWVSTSAKTANGTRTTNLETGKVLAQGEGVGYRLGVNETGANSLAYATTNVNLRSAALEFAAAAPRTGNGSSSVQAAVSGALVAVDGFWGSTRLVNDGFALAKLGVPQEGVEISLNNQVQGRTDKDGKLFIPQVWSFTRQDVSVAEKQLGMEFSLRERRKTIVPGYRSGTVVEFGGRKVRAAAGMAWLVTPAGREPISARVINLSGKTGTVHLETGNAGDFYIEDATAGSYEGTLPANGRRFRCRLTIPPTEDVVHDLAEGVICE